MKRVGTICLSLTHEVKYSLLNETSPKNYGKKLEKVFISSIVFEGGAVLLAYGESY